MRRQVAGLALAVLLTAVSATASAQDVRYSWFDIGVGVQDVGKAGSLTDAGLGQTVDVSASDGDGVRFRGSVGTWKNLFAYIDFRSSDIDVAALVTNNQGMFPAEDEFDFTVISGGVGLRWPLRQNVDIYGLLTYDSLDFDFGSFAGEDFDAGDKDLGGTLGVRAIWKDRFELRAHARYTGVGNVDLSSGKVSDDTLIGLGFGYEIIRGLSLTADFESGEFSHWNIGFRLDLSED